MEQHEQITQNTDSELNHHEDLYPDLLPPRSELLHVDL